MFLAWRNTKLPGPIVIVALADPLAICAVATDVADAEPLAFVAVTVTFKYCPTSAATNLCVELTAPEMFAYEPPDVADRLQ